MNGHDIVGGILVVKAAVDTIRSCVALVRGRPPVSALVPVYRPVPKPTRAGSSDAAAAVDPDPSR